MPVDRMTKLFAKFQLIFRQLVNIHIRQHTFHSCICLQKSFNKLKLDINRIRESRNRAPANNGVS